MSMKMPKLINVQWRKTDLSFSFELDASAELGKEDQIKNYGSSKQRVLAGVVQHNGAFPTHEYLRGVLIHSSLAIPNIWHILWKEKPQKTTQNWDQDPNTKIDNLKAVWKRLIPWWPLRGQDAPQAHRGCHCWRPCHPQHCFLKSLWNGRFVGPRDSCRRYYLDDYSSL